MRVTVINQLLKRLGRETAYLEIGCDRDRTFDRVQATVKVGVDPVRGGTHRMTSDAYFAQCDQWFDVIFIDGLHLAEQVIRDVRHALQRLLPGGVILLHDTLPRDHVSQLRERRSSHWHGDVWRAVLEIQNWGAAGEAIDVQTLDADSGLSLIVRRDSMHEAVNTRMSFDTDGIRRAYQLVGQLDPQLQSRLWELPWNLRQRHVIVTRYAMDTGFGLGRWRNLWWQQDRQQLFETWTAPSLLQQTAHVDWVLLVHPEVQIRPEIRHQHTWIETTSASVRKPLMEHLLRTTRACVTDLITTRLDSDDALLPEYCQRVQQAAIPGEITWLNPLAGVVWQSGQAVRVQASRNAFQSLATPWRGRETPLVYDRAHTETEPLDIAVNEPLWVQVRHGGNVSNGV